MYKVRKATQSLPGSISSPVKWGSQSCCKGLNWIKYVKVPTIASVYTIYKVLSNFKTDERNNVDETKNKTSSFISSSSNIRMRGVKSRILYSSTRKDEHGSYSRISGLLTYCIVTYVVRVGSLKTF